MRFLKCVCLYVYIHTNIDILYGVCNMQSKYIYEVDL